MANVDTFTANYNLTKTAYDSRQWQDKVNDNFAIIDAVMGSFAAISGMKGTWKNSTAYEINDVVVDPDLGTLWKCLSPHTSAATGTFLEDRLANPSRWTPYAQAASFRGEWQPGTNYNFNDFVVKTNLGIGRYAIALTSHVSGSDFDADVALGRWAILVDGGLYVLPTLAGITDANKVVVADPTGTIYTIISRLTLYNSFGLPPSADINEVINNVKARFKVSVQITNGFIAINAPNIPSLLHISQDAGVTNQAVWDSYAQQNLIVLRRAEGTPAAPSAIINGASFGAISCMGYGATGYGNYGALIQFIASQNWNDTQQGSGIDFYGVPNNSVTRTLALKLVGGEVTILNLPAWTPFVPAFAPTGGSGTTFSVGTSRFIRLGKLVIGEFEVIITGVGTGTGSINVSGLPATSFNTGGAGYAGCGVETNTVGYQVSFMINANQATGILRRYDVANIIILNHRFNVSFVYETN